MRIFRVTILILSILSLLACEDAPKTSSSTTPSTEDGVIRIKQKAEKLEMGKKASAANVDLSAYGIANNPNNVLGGLKKGDKAPDFSMLDQDGKVVSLEDNLKDGPVLLVFLRAEWCSFCVRHLKEFQDNIQSINEDGHAKVIAISPQTTSYMKEFHDENEFSFPILYDEDHSVMKDYKVFFHVTEKYNNYIEKAKGERIEVFNGDKEPVMPVPATYLINQDKTIRYVHYDNDYKKRSDLKDVMGYF